MLLGRRSKRKGKDELRWSWVAARATCPLHERLRVGDRRDLGGLEKTPTTTSLAPPVPTLAPANSRNQTASRTGRQIGCQDAQQPDRTACCARRGRRAGGGHKEREGEADEKDGGASHRIGRPPRLHHLRALAIPAQGAQRCLRYPPGCAAMARAPRRQRAARHRRQHRAGCSGGRGVAQS